MTIFSSVYLSVFANDEGDNGEDSDEGDYEDGYDESNDEDNDDDHEENDDDDDQSVMFHPYTPHCIWLFSVHLLFADVFACGCVSICLTFEFIFGIFSPS